MREEIDNTIIKELDTIYSPNVGGVETEFKQSLNDVSLERDFLEQQGMIQIVRTFGGNAVLIYLYLHTKMCEAGYRIEWNDIAIEISCAMLKSLYKVNEETVITIINEFVKSKMLYIITENNKPYLTSLYQVYMYERISAKRLRDRICKRNKSAKKNEKYTIVQTVPAFENCDNKSTNNSNVDNMFQGISGEEFFK